MKHVLRTSLVLSAAMAVVMGCQTTKQSGEQSSAALAPTLSPGQRVDDFRLLDHAGASHQLYYSTDKKAIVLIAQGDSCVANTKSLPEIKKLRDKYGAKNVEFLMINSNLGNSREQIDAVAKKQGIDLPILMDSMQLIGESLGLRNNGEVLVVNTQGWKLAYRGDAKNTAAALDSVLAGAPVKTAVTKVSGCTINMPEVAHATAHADISYEKTIAPMLINNCVTCHRKGGIGPFAMTSYNTIHGYAPMIREVLRTERMPPWHADPHYGTFSNSRALSADNVKTLVHWIEAGAPRGAGDDPLAEMKKTWPQWAMGKPDVVLELPAFNVPATGVIPYQDVHIKNPIGRDVWLTAIDYAPGDRSIVHHILGYTLPAGMGSLNGDREHAPADVEVAGKPGPASMRLMKICSSPAGAASIHKRLSGDDSVASFGGASIGGYVPGAVPAKFPGDAGVLLKKDSEFRFQIHYTPTGKAGTDVTHVGLYFSDQPPKFSLHNTVLLDPCLQIPANTEAYTASMSRVITRDILLYSLTPHSHYRGTASNFIAEYPDGTKETLLSVPRYDFNWQTTYAFAKPKFIPKGTKLTHSTTYDNSTLNKSNPDPSIVVHWGEQTWEEMLYGAISFRYADEATDEQKVSQVTRK